MKEGRDGNRSRKGSESMSVSSLPLILDIDNFKGEFSFDSLFGNLVCDLLPSFQDEAADSVDGHRNISEAEVLPNGHVRAPSDMTKVQGISSPLFPELDTLLTLFRDSCRELIDLWKQIDSRLYNLKKEVSAQDSAQQTLVELEKGVDGFFDSFAHLDSCISGVGQTAAKIGDHLQSGDAQRETASQTIELIKDHLLKKILEDKAYLPNPMWEMSLQVEA